MNHEESGLSDRGSIRPHFNSTRQNKNEQMPQESKLTSSNKSKQSNYNLYTTQQKEKKSKEKGEDKNRGISNLTHSHLDHECLESILSRTAGANGMTQKKQQNLMKEIMLKHSINLLTIKPSKPLFTHCN